MYYSTNSHIKRPISHFLSNSESKASEFKIKYKSCIRMILSKCVFSFLSIWGWYGTAKHATNQRTNMSSGNSEANATELQESIEKNVSSSLIITTCWTWLHE